MCVPPVRPDTAQATQLALLKYCTYGYGLADHGAAYAVAARRPPRAGQTLRACRHSVGLPVRYGVFATGVGLTLTGRDGL